MVVFTASSQDYADKILDGIDPEGKYISDRLYREHCFEYDGKKIALYFSDIFLKDLRMIENFKKIDMVIVDNLICSFALDMKNGIPVKPYCYGDEDYELEFIAGELEKMSEYTKANDFLEDTFGLSQFYEFFS